MLTHWTGFVMTDLNAPFQLALGASDVLVGKPAGFGGMTFTGSATVTLRPSP
jgi:hypothetical protein